MTHLYTLHFFTHLYLQSLISPLEAKKKTDGCKITKNKYKKPLKSLAFLTCPISPKGA